MRKGFQLFFGLCYLLFVTNKAFSDPDKTAPAITKMVVNAGIYEFTHRNFIDVLGEDVCKNIRLNYHDRTTEPGIVDILILCQAFESQGIDIVLNLKPYPNYLRALSMVETGVVDILTASVWHDDINSTFIMGSDDVVRSGEFQKGIYFYEKNPLLKTPPEQIDLSQYTAISVTAWHHDWEVLNSLTDSRVEATTYPRLFSMLAAGRADFTLMMFSNRPNLEIYRENHIFIPLKNFKVAFKSSRKFVVSKKFPQAKLYHQTLNQGLTAMRQKHRIVKLLEESGFLSIYAKNWQVINQ